MRSNRVVLLAAVLLLIENVHAQSAGEGPTLRNVQTDVQISNSQFVTVAGSAGAMLRPLPAGNISVGGGDILIGAVEACGNARVDGASTKVRISNSSASAAGRINIGSIRAGVCP